MMHYMLKAEPEIEGGRVLDCMCRAHKAIGSRRNKTLRLAAGTSAVVGSVQDLLERLEALIATQLGPMLPKATPEIMDRRLAAYERHIENLKEEVEEIRTEGYDRRYDDHPDWLESKILRNACRQQARFEKVEKRLLSEAKRRKVQERRGKNPECAERGPAEDC
jgi:hypothetical protein